MELTRLANKTQGGEANPSNFGLQNMFFATKNTLKFSRKKPKKGWFENGKQRCKSLRGKE